VISSAKEELEKCTSKSKKKLTIMSHFYFLLKKRILYWKNIVLVLDFGNSFSFEKLFFAGILWCGIRERVLLLVRFERLYTYMMCNYSCCCIFRAKWHGECALKVFFLENPTIEEKNDFKYKVTK